MSEITGITTEKRKNNRVIGIMTRMIEILPIMTGRVKITTEMTKIIIVHK